MAQTYDCPCNTCAWALWDYEEFYGGGKQWFFVDCEKGCDVPMPGEDCEGYLEHEDKEDW